MFVVSKIVAALMDPLALVLAAAILLFTRYWRLARVLLAAVLAIWLLPPAEPLEDRFPSPSPLPARIEGIIVLGGAVNPAISAARGQPAVGGSAERLLALPDLLRRYPQARVVFTGGSGAVMDQQHKEAPYARAVLQAMGVDTAHILFEDQSRNTRENAVYSRELARPQGKWLLVTSAMHMPRAMGTFRADGWDVIGFPVDYTTPGGGNSQAALKEWVGLLYYWLRGWSEALYPAP